MKLESRVWGSKGHLQYLEDIGGTKFVTDFNLQSVKTFRTKMSLSHLNSYVKGGFVIGKYFPSEHFLLQAAEPWTSSAELRNLESCKTPRNLRGIPWVFKRNQTSEDFGAAVLLHLRCVLSNRVARYVLNAVRLARKVFRLGLKIIHSSIFTSFYLSGDVLINIPL